MKMNETVENISTSDLLYDVPTYLIVLLTLLYGAVSLSAVIGNGIVLWVVVRSKKLRTVTNIFIANLATADILIGALAIPFQFQAALLQKWVLPHFMCPFCPFVQIVSVNVSVFTLTAVAADRYLVVFHPTTQRITKIKAKIIIVFIWTVAVVAAIPAAVALRVTIIPDIESAIDINEGVLTLMTTMNDTLRFRNVTIPMKPFCDNVALDKSLWTLYNTSLVVIQYFLPLTIITYAYGRMGLRLRSGSKKRARVKRSLRLSSMRPEETEESSFVDFEKISTQMKRDSVPAPAPVLPQAEYIHVNKRKVIKMLVVVVALFALCWLPLQTYNLLQDLAPDINAYRYINVIWFCCHWLAMSNSSINPFVYAIYTVSTPNTIIAFEAFPKSVWTPGWNNLFILRN